MALQRVAAQDAGPLLRAALLGVAWIVAVRAMAPPCYHCQTGEAFTEVLKPRRNKTEGTYQSDVHVLWPAHVEVVPLTEDIGGPYPAKFHERLAQGAIDGWKYFRDEVAQGLPKNHFLQGFLNEGHAGALNDGFFHWQKALFEAEGDVKKALEDKQGPVPTPNLEANTSWPAMEGLPEYRQLRSVVEALSRRYLIRSGLVRSAAEALQYSVFNWAAVHRPGEFHGPHTHVGEYHVGVFYAQAGRDAGKLRFGDPRGHSPPFGKTFFFTPKSGHLVFFPSWLSHMATVTAPESSKQFNSEGEVPLRVIFSFNIGPYFGPLQCHHWFQDPTGDMRFSRPSVLDPKELGLDDL